LILTRRKLVLTLGGTAATAILAACGAPASPTAAPAKPTEAPKPAAPAAATAPASAPTTAPAAATKPAATTAPAAATTAPAAAATPAAAAPAAAGAGPKVLYWGSFAGNLGKAEQETVDRFNKQSKTVQVDYQFQGSYEETANKLSAALAARQGLPDVTILSDVWWQKFWLNKTIAPFDAYLQAQKVDKADYVDSFIVEGTRQGKLMWIPFARSTPMMYYNKDHFKEAGLNPDKAPETWTEIIEAGQKLTKREGNNITRPAILMALAASYNAWVFLPVVWQWGGRYSDDDMNIKIQEKEAVAAGQHYVDLVFKHKIATVPKDNNADFQNGLGSIIFNSTASLAGIEANSKFPVGTGFLPKGPAGFGCCTGGSGLALMQGSPEEKRAAAFEYVKFATSPEHTAWWSQNTGYMPVRKSAIDSKEMNDFYKQKPNFTTAVKQLAQTKPQDWARVGIPNGDQMIGKGLERITVAQEPVEQVFKELQAQLEKEGKPVVEQFKKLQAG
jgi:sn-glycerol 3-phosphate transport system substrate-binding protein